MAIYSATSVKILVQYDISPCRHSPFPHLRLRKILGRIISKERGRLMTLPTNNGILRPGISDLQFMHPTNLTDPLMKEFYRLFLFFCYLSWATPLLPLTHLKMFGLLFRVLSPIPAGQRYLAHRGCVFFLPRVIPTAWLRNILRLCRTNRSLCVIQKKR